MQGGISVRHSISGHLHRSRPKHRNLLDDVEKHREGARACRKRPPTRRLGSRAILHAYLHGELDLFLGIPLFSELHIDRHGLHPRVTLLLRQRWHCCQLGLEHLA